MVYYAVLHLPTKSPLSVYLLGARVYTCMTENKATFAEPDPTMEVYNNALKQLDESISAKDGTKLKNQLAHDKMVIVYDFTKRLLVYVNKVCKNDRSLILLSGFDCNNEPTSKQIPGKAVIKRASDGSTVCSVKIYIEKLTDADRYKIEMTLTPEDPESWDTLLDPASMHDLEVGGLPRAKDVCLRVVGGNRHGWGIPSDYIVFVPR